MGALQPHTSQCSYYGKARYTRQDDISTLYSYNTKVAEFNHYTNDFRIFGFYSATTLKHIKSFLYQYNDTTYTKKELEKYLV